MRIVGGFYNGRRIPHGWINNAIIRFIGTVVDVDLITSATAELHIDSDARPTLVVFLNSNISTEPAGSNVSSSAIAHSVGYKPFDITLTEDTELQETADASVLQLKSFIFDESNNFDVNTFANGLRVVIKIAGYRPKNPDNLNCVSFANALIAGVIRDFDLKITTAIQISSTATGVTVQNLDILEAHTDSATVECDSIASAQTFGIVDEQIYTDLTTVENENFAVASDVDMDGSELSHVSDVDILSIDCFASAEINRTAFLTFTGLNSDFTLETQNHTKNWDGILEYSTDLSEWTEWNGSSVLRSKNKKLYLSGLNNTFITGDNTDSTKRFVLNGDNEITCKGNLLSLLDYNKAVSVEATQDITVAPAAFAYLFYENTNLISAPYMVKADLTNSDYCYKCTYYGTKVQSIDTTTVKSNITSGTEFISGFIFDGVGVGCFWSMFEGSNIQNMLDTGVSYSASISHDCNSYSFYRMFANCPYLTTSMKIGVKGAVSYCCMQMYENCIGLVSMNMLSIPYTPTSTIAEHAMDSMFKGCSSLQSIDAIFVQSLFDGIYGIFAPYMCASMFEGCTSLKRLIAISRYTGATKNYYDHCFDSMYKGCSNIKLSRTSSSTYKYTFIIPNKTTGTTYTTSLADMFAETGGTFIDTPTFGTTYYTEEPSYGYVKISIYDGDTLYVYGSTSKPNPYYTLKPAAIFSSVGLPSLATYLPQKSGYFFDRWNTKNGGKSAAAFSMDTDLYIGWSDQADIELDMDYTGVTTSYVDQQFRFKQSAGYALIIDWGDGSAQSTTSSTSNTYLTHRYTVKDKYTIKARCNTAAATPPTWEPLSYSNYSCVGAYYYSDGSSSNRPNTTLTEVRFNNGDRFTNYGSPNYAWGYRAFILSNALKKVTFGSGFMSSGNSTFNLCPALEDVVLSEDMQTIGEYNFSGDTSLKSINIPSTITTINRNAFYNCYLLPPITFPDTITTIEVYAFYNCRLITDAILPDSLTTLGNTAFNGCSSLHNLHIGSSLTTLYGQTFVNCPLDGTITIDDGNASYRAINNIVYNQNMTEVVLGGKNAVIGTSAEYASVDAIGSYAFYGRIDGDYTIPSQINGTIGIYAFAHCNIPSLTLNCTNTTFGTNAFSSTVVNRANILSLVQWCNFIFNTTLSSTLHLYINSVELTDITIPASISSIGAHQFENAQGITSLTLPNNVTYVDGTAFQNCTNLNYVYTPDVCTYNSNAFYRCTNIKTVSIGDANVPTVFASSKTSIETIMVRDSVTTLSGTFSGLTALKSVTLSNTLTTIPYNAFSGCTSLIDIILPSSLTSIGEDAFSGCTSLSDVTFTGTFLKTIKNGTFGGCSALVNIIIPDGVETLNNAFNNCTSLESITLPNSLKTMYCTFTNCPNVQYNVYQGLNYLGNSSNLHLVVVSGQDNTVTTVTLHNDTKIINGSAFSSYASLTSATLNNSLITIGSSAFQNCTSLTSMIIPNSVTTINSSAFRACTELTTCTLSTSLETIGGNAFYECTKLNNVTLPDSLIEVGESVFYACTSLSDVTIGSGLDTIGASMFNSCTSLTTIVIPDNVTTINGAAFNNSGLTSISLSKYVTALQGKAQYTPFSGCASLTSIIIDSENTVYKSNSNCIIQIDNNTLVAGCKTSTIPTDGSVRHIGTGAFLSIPITSITIPNSVTSIDLYAFSGTSISTIVIPDTVTTLGNDVFAECSLLTQATLSNSLTTISQNTFYRCVLLDNIVIPNTVITLSSNAFSGCTSLQNIALSTALTTIDSSVFSGCSALATIDMPSTMTTIGSNAYQNCTSLMSITCRATTPPSLASTSLSNVPTTCLIYVPSASVSRYKSATNWSARSAYIQAIP